MSSYRLAQLYHDLGNNDKAAYYYKKNLDRRDQEGVCITIIATITLPPFFVDAEMGWCR